MIRLIFKILGLLLVFVLLTMITQIGGVVFLLAVGISTLAKRRINATVVRVLMLPLVFVTLYLLFTALVTPFIAGKYGREPLPWRGDLRPLSVWTCLLNRHYVRSPLKELALESTAKMRKAFPDTHINYLDANLPFYDGFPLVPHLSHNDGRKLDIALFYMDAKGKPLDDTPSPIGYGVFVDPRPGDEDLTEICEGKGFWQYGVMEKIISQKRKPEYILDAKRQKKFIDLLINDKRLHKLLIEPHLKTRMKLNSSKIRYHGCHAVRHDDHIHIQIR
jgi:hypothetical protein